MELWINACSSSIPKNSIDSPDGVSVPELG